MAKYKQILKGQKNLFNKLYQQVCNPNKTVFENTQATYVAFGKLLKDYYGTEDDHVAKLTAVGLKGMIDEMNNVMTHYFIKDKSLIQFLQETEVHDTSIVNEYLKENGATLKGKDNYYSIALHTEDDGYLLTYLFDENKTVIVVISDMHSFDFVLSNRKIKDPTCRMAINLIYYLKCYPEKILNGVPDDMVKNDKKKMKDCTSKTIGIADEIVEKTEIVNGHLVSPHFRSGFFRHYSDDRYINMKGKVQFIAATMVKGKAKTVVA